MEDALLLSARCSPRGLGDASMCLTNSSSALVSRSEITGSAGLGGDEACWLVCSFAGLLAAEEEPASLPSPLAGVDLSGGFHTGSLAVSNTESSSSLGIPPIGADELLCEPASDSAVVTGGCGGGDCMSRPFFGESWSVMDGGC